MGGSPSWAGAPVAVFGVTTGILGFIERRKDSSAVNPVLKLPHRPVIVALCLFLAAVGLQLVPLPESVLTRLSPAHDVADFERLLATADLRDPELVSQKAPGTPRALSIVPSRTWWGLGFIVAFSLFLIGAARGLSAGGLRGVTTTVIVLGVLVALLGIHQITSNAVALYGLYVPITRPDAGPFINRNHQAGWLVMVVVLAAGSFAGEVARGMRVVKPSWRDRILWFSSKQANVAVLLLLAFLVLAIGVLVTASRSGASILLLALIVLAAAGGRRLPSQTRGRVLVVALSSVAVIAVITNGSALLTRFSTSSASADVRLSIWSDSLRILRDFWITGTGFNTFGTAMLDYQRVPGLRIIEAHNDYLQIAAEGGLLIGIPALILIASVVIEIRGRFREGADDTRTYWLRVGAVAGIIAIAAQSLVDFTLQMPGAAVMFATLVAIAVHHPPRRHNPASG